MDCCCDDDAFCRFCHPNSRTGTIYDPYHAVRIEPYSDYLTDPDDDGSFTLKRRRLSWEERFGQLGEWLDCRLGYCGCEEKE